MIRQLLVGVAGIASMALGAWCAVMTDPPVLGAVAGGVLAVCGAAALTWAVGAA